MSVLRGREDLRERVITDKEGRALTVRCEGLEASYIMVAGPSGGVRLKEVDNGEEEAGAVRGDQ